MFGSEGKAKMAAPPAANGHSATVKLRKAIATHQGNISEVKFSPLTAELLIRHRKLPFTIREMPGGGREVDTDFKLAAAYIADLTGHDELVLGQMHPLDFSACVAKLGELVSEAGN